MTLEPKLFASCDFIGRMLAPHSQGHSNSPQGGCCIISLLLHMQNSVHLPWDLALQDFWRAGKNSAAFWCSPRPPCWKSSVLFQFEERLFFPSITPGRKKAELQAKKLQLNHSEFCSSALSTMFLTVFKKGLMSPLHAHLVRHPWGALLPIAWASLCSIPQERHPRQKGNFSCAEFLGCCRDSCDRQAGQGSFRAAWDENKTFTLSWCIRNNF